MFKRLRGSNPQQRLLSRLRNANAFDHADDGGGDAMPVQSSKSPARIQPGLYNKPFKAQIQMQFLKYYFSEAAGVYTEIAAAALAAQLKVNLPNFMFLNSDFDAGYAKLQAAFPVAGGWTYNPPIVFNKNANPGSTVPAGAFVSWDVTVRAKCVAGDIILPFTTAAIAGTKYVAIVIMRVSDVAYASLQGATNSNTFSINRVRYTVAVGQEAQFANPVLTTDLTMFGRYTSDPVNPEAFVSPEQQKDNIVDIDIEYDINKQTGFATSANFDVVNYRWNFFIARATKIV